MSEGSILIVDDTAANIRVLADILADEFEIRVATSGEDALRFVEQEPTDLILLDVMMPNMDGYEVCKRLKENPQTSKIPVIFVTALNSAEAEVKGLQAGAVDFISKPFNHLVVQARTRTHVKLHRQSLLLEEFAKKDALTSIANRREYDERIKMEWNRAQRDKTEMSLIMFDMDCFKEYNDTYGHGSGDECLRKIVKAVDAIPKRNTDLFARYGGDELMFLLPKTSKENACHIAHKIIEAVVSLKILHETSAVKPYVTVSIGVASTFPKQNEDAGMLEKAVDDALYKAKENGRDQIYCAEQIL
jgi:diguanylate cyclase (GGDEF)-like protein